MKPIISVKNLSKKISSDQILNRVSFNVQAGEVLAIIGPSGAGKTTLLRCLNLLTNFDQGQIEVAGFALEKSDFEKKKLREKVGMVFQEFNLWPNKTVLENVAYAPRVVKGLSQGAAWELGRKALERVYLAGKEGAYPQELSGGQQQRVAIARALAMEPQVLLLDEITSALDPELIGEVLGVIKEIAGEHKTTLLIVTHQISFAREVADKILFLDQGQVVEQGVAREVLREPKQERTQQFLSRVLNKF